MAGSTVPVVKALIVSTLKLRAGIIGPPAVQVLYAQAGETGADEAIYLGQVRARHEYAALGPGRKRRIEEYTIDLFVSVSRAADDIQQAEARAFVLMKEVEDMLADDPKLGSAVLDSAGIGNWELDSGIGDKGGAARIRIEIDCDAQLS